nr:hypothetical protein [Tanacetum cinerariifolium]
MQHVPKCFQVDDVLFVFQFESDEVLMNISCSPEFLHVNFRYICSNKERLEKGTSAQNIVDDLQSGFLGLNVRCQSANKCCDYRHNSYSLVKSSDANSSSSYEIAKLTHAVNQQTSNVTTAMTAILKQFQVAPPSASVKSIEEICVTCGGAHPYYLCLATDGNTFPELRDNIQGYVAAAAVNYNRGNFGYPPPGVANQIRPRVLLNRM